jgi:hypothetical protein
MSVDAMDNIAAPLQEAEKDKEMHQRSRQYPGLLAPIMYDLVRASTPKGAIATMTINMETGEATFHTEQNFELQYEAFHAAQHSSNPASSGLSGPQSRQSSHSNIRLSQTTQAAAEDHAEHHEDSLATTFHRAFPPLIPEQPDFKSALATTPKDVPCMNTNQPPVNVMIVELAEQVQALIRVQVVFIFVMVCLIIVHAVLLIEGMVGLHVHCVLGKELSR